jgi:hypothetical protein
MAGTALVTTVCVLTIVAIRWLAVLGVVRVYAVTRTTGSFPPSGGGWSSSTSGTFGQLGLTSGPSAALTHLDQLTWKVGLFAGILWVLRLGLRSADHRIGGLRGVGIAVGLGVFVVTGVAHRIAEAVIPSERSRDWVDHLISLWCFAAVLTTVFAVASVHESYAPTGALTSGDHAVLASAGWSFARNASQLVVAVGGWWMAVVLTRRWVVIDERSRAPRRSAPA